MKLEDITVKIRPRDAWEAIDLGFKFTQQNWRVIYFPWAIFLIAVVLVVSIGLQRWPLFSLFVIWWLKPVYDRVLLSICSRTLFNDKPGTEETLRSIPQSLRSQLFSGLSYHRFSFARSFFLPVTLLEKLHGNERKKRCSILSLRTSGHATWLTVTCLIFEQIMSITLIGLIYLMIPENHEADFMSVIFNDDYTLQQSLIINLMYGLGIFIIEPFYVAAGFMLYINRRTVLEGWDIELSFRNLSNRLSQLIKGSATTLLVLISLSPLLFTHPAHAEQDDEYPEEPIAQNLRPVTDSSTVIKEIYTREEMGKKETHRELKYIGDDDFDTDEDSFDISGIGELIVYMAQTFKIVLVLIVVILIATAILQREKWLHLLGIGEQQKKDETVIESLFGMDLRPHSLPDDIANSARRLAENNDLRGALSLLYRGVLSILVNHDKLAITSALTENEILTLANDEIKNTRKNYLSQLTNEWIRTAYSQSISTKDLVLSLCDQWPQFKVQQ